MPANAGSRRGPQGFIAEPEAAAAKPVGRVARVGGALVWIGPIAKTGPAPMPPSDPAGIEIIQSIDCN
jgi:hypothetical protein